MYASKHMQSILSYALGPTPQPLNKHTSSFHHRRSSLPFLSVSHFYLHADFAVQSSPAEPPCIASFPSPLPSPLFHQASRHVAMQINEAQRSHTVPTPDYPETCRPGWRGSNPRSWSLLLASYFYSDQIRSDQESGEVERNGLGQDSQ